MPFEKKKKEREEILHENENGFYLDTFKKYSLLTNENYRDTMDSNKRFLSRNEKEIPFCMYNHDNDDSIIAFEKFKYEEKKGFKREGYTVMSDYHKQLLYKYLDKKRNSYAQIVEDKSFGVICCVKQKTHSSDPIIAAVRLIKSPKYLSIPKGHPLNNESEINCALRELREEISIDASKYIDSNLYTFERYTFTGPMRDDEWKMHKDYPNVSKRPFCVYYKEVKFFLAILPEKVDLNPQPEEILKCKWVPLSDLKKNVHPNTKNMLTSFFDSKKVKSKLVSSASDPHPFFSFQNMLKKKPIIIQSNKIKNQNSIESTESNECECNKSKNVIKKIFKLFSK